MNKISPKEAIINLNHIYGMVAPDIQRSLDVAIKALENIDKLNKALDNLSRPFSSILNGIEVNKGDTISREGLKSFAKEKLGDNTLSITMFKVFEEIIDNAPPVPERPQGDLIRREALKEDLAKEIQTNDMGLWLKILLVIDNAQAIPQVTVFTENTDEKAVADMKAELQNVIGARPKGEWKKLYGQNFYCSNCKKDREQNHINFCGYCGADMT